MSDLDHLETSLPYCKNTKSDLGHVPAFIEMWAHQLAEFYKSREYCDAILNVQLSKSFHSHCDSKLFDTIPIHRIILASASPIFRTLFHPSHTCQVVPHQHQILASSFAENEDKRLSNHLETTTSSSSTTHVFSRLLFGQELSTVEEPVELINSTGLPVYYLENISDLDGLYHCLQYIYTGNAPLTLNNAMKTRSVAVVLELSHFVQTIDTFLLELWSETLKSDLVSALDTFSFDIMYPTFKPHWIEWTLCGLRYDSPFHLLECLVNCAATEFLYPIVSNSNMPLKKQSLEFIKFKFISHVISLQEMSQETCLQLYEFVCFSNFTVDQLEVVYQDKTVPSTLLAKLLMENLKSRSHSDDAVEEEYEEAPTITEKDIKLALQSDSGPAVDASWYHTPGHTLLMDDSPLLDKNEAVLKGLDSPISMNDTSPLSVCTELEQVAMPRLDTISPVPVQQPDEVNNQDPVNVEINHQDPVKEPSRSTDTLFPSHPMVEKNSEPSMPSFYIPVKQPEWKKIAAFLDAKRTHEPSTAQESCTSSLMSEEDSDDHLSRLQDTEPIPFSKKRVKNQPHWLWNLWKIDEADETLYYDHEDDRHLLPMEFPKMEPLILQSDAVQVDHVAVETEYESISQQHGQDSNTTLDKPLPQVAEYQKNEDPKANVSTVVPQFDMYPHRPSTPELLNIVQQKLIKMKQEEMDQVEIDDCSIRKPKKSIKQAALNIMGKLHLPKRNKNMPQLPHIQIQDYSHSYKRPPHKLPDIPILEPEPQSMNFTQSEVIPAQEIHVSQEKTSMIPIDAEEDIFFTPLLHLSESVQVAAAAEEQNGPFDLVSHEPSALGIEISPNPHLKETIASKSLDTLEQQHISSTYDRHRHWLQHSSSVVFAPDVSQKELLEEMGMMDESMKKPSILDNTSFLTMDQPSFIQEPSLSFNVSRIHDSTAHASRLMSVLDDTYAGNSKLDSFYPFARERPSRRHVGGARPAPFPLYSKSRVPERFPTSKKNRKSMPAHPPHGSLFEDCPRSSISSDLSADIPSFSFDQSTDKFNNISWISRIKVKMRPASKTLIPSADVPCAI